MTPVFRHGRLRLYLLRLLDEEPRHGYEVIRLLRDRFMGVYAPSPGTIYPRLARLEEEGLVTHDEENGRKVYRITEAGREELRKRGDELNELEQELSASVSDIVREVKEDVRETVRSLREELTKAAREMRQPQGIASGPSPADAAPASAAAWADATVPDDAGPGEARPGAQGYDPAGAARPGEGPASGRDEARAPRDAWGQARETLGSTSIGGTSIGSAWAQAREQARLLREQAKHARDHAREQARQARDGALGRDGTLGQAAQQAANRIREEAANFRDDLGERGGWHSWGDWASWADWPGRKSWPGPGPHNMAAFRDLERLVRSFANDMRKVAWDSGALGGDVLANLHTILDEALDRIKSEVLGPPHDDRDQR
jgi:DNA-binding PadR family transcriptional regulator